MSKEYASRETICCLLGKECDFKRLKRGERSECEPWQWHCAPFLASDAKNGAQCESICFLEFDLVFAQQPVKLGEGKSGDLAGLWHIP